MNSYVNKKVRLKMIRPLDDNNITQVA